MQPRSWWQQGGRRVREFAVGRLGWMPPWAWRAAALAGAMLLIGYVLVRLPIMSPQANYAGVVAAWLAALALYLAAIARRGSTPRHVWRLGWQARPWLEPVLVGLLVLAALVLRLWRIGDIPFVISGDEASFGFESMRVVKGVIRNPLTLGHLSQPTMSFFPASLTIRLWGLNIAALRIPWAIVGAATIVVVYLMVRRLWGPRLALVTSALLAVYHFHIHYSRVNLNNIADPLLASLMVLLFYRALDTNRPQDWGLMGAASGFALYFYTGARFIPILAVTIALRELLPKGKRSPRRLWLGYLVAAGAFLIVAAPMLQLAIRDPYTFNSRPNYFGIIQSGYLAQQSQVAAGGALEVLADQFQRAVLAFNFYADQWCHYGLHIPLLDAFFGALFLLGLGYATIRALLPRGDRRLFPMVAWWWGGIILGGMLTKTPPSSQRLITLSVPVCFFVAFCMWKLVGIARRAFTGIPRQAILLAGVCAFAIVSLRTYFVDFTPRRLAGGSRAEMVTQLAPLLAEVMDTHRFYLAGAPYMVWNFPTFPFLFVGVEGHDIHGLFTAPPPADFVPGDTGVVFIFVPERSQEVVFLAETFPSGELTEVRRPSDGQLVATLYIVPPP